MKVKLKNLGVLKQAEFELGNLTILCGGNNTGKTYATYALFGFLHYMHNDSIGSLLEGTELEKRITGNVLRISITEYIQLVLKQLHVFCNLYTKKLPKVFSMSEDKFLESYFMVEIDTEYYLSDLQKKISIKNMEDLPHIKITMEEQNTLVIELENKSDSKSMDYFMGYCTAFFSFFHLVGFPSPFIISSERTGAAIFRKELNFARSRLLEEINQNKNLDPRKLMATAYQDYPLPVKENLEFSGNLDSITKHKSFIQEKHPEILEDFADIIGGSYTLNSQNELRYTPKTHPRMKLSMDESSSAVRSLVDLGFFLKHVANPRHLLIIDEPELNLHPENQRRVARLLARLVNIGIKVLITTHSDYMIREFNTLIMLNQDKPHLEKVMADEGYKPEELLAVDKIKAYVAGAVTPKNRKTPYYTLTPIEVAPDSGMEISSFETTLDTMNRIQESIIWGTE